MRSAEWTFETISNTQARGQIFSSPAVSGTTVYFSSGFTTYVSNPDGTERWHRTTIRNMYDPAVGDDGTTYVQAMYKSGGTGAVYALNSVYAIRPVQGRLYLPVVLKTG